MTPKTALKGTTLMVDVVLSQSGFDGQKVTLDVEDEGTLVSTQQVSLPNAGTPASIPVRFTVNEAGPRVLRFRVSPQPGELVTENNAREALIDVRDRKEKILYFEGEPRFEYKFIRRAIPEGDNLIVTSLIRTADNKYMRQGVDGPDELVAAFPKTREELFAYRSLIIGSLEAAALTGDQLQHDLGVRRSPRRRPVDARRSARLRRRRLGRHRGRRRAAGRARSQQGAAEGHRDAADGQADARRHRDRGDAARRQRSRRRRNAGARCPVVTAVNRIDAVKPGATVLLTGTDESRAERPMLIFQRYGRGKSFAFLPQDSWILADARDDSRRGPDARELLAAAAAVAGRRRARPSRAGADHRARRAGRGRDA